jgi:protease-4
MGVEGTYRRFVMLVANARHLPPARVNEIAQGRVWDGGTAHQLGLVDRFGSLGDAIAEAARRAHLDPAGVRPVYLEKEPGWLARLFADAARDDDNDRGDSAAAGRDAFASLSRRPEAMALRALHDARELLTGPAIQARCLECAQHAPVAAAPADESFWARLLALVWRG